MRKTSQQIAKKAWSLAHALREDGPSYMTYADQFTAVAAELKRA